MFRQQMTRIVLVAKYDKIKLSGSNNMYRIQLWALATDTALYLGSISAALSCLV